MQTTTINQEPGRDRETREMDERSSGDEQRGSAADQIKRSFEQRAERVRPEDEERVAGSLQDRVNRLVNSANAERPFVMRMLSSVKLLWAMLRESSFHMEWTTRGAIIAALLYFISPLDVFPDVLPIIGVIDDAFVLSLVVAQLNNEIERFKDYLRALIAEPEA